ncbi:MAG: ribosome biogenesis GTPase Der, partial [Thermodesulfobacteriota bacterium]
ELSTVDFHTLGLDNFVAVSAVHGRRIDDLLDAIIETLPRAEFETHDKDDNVVKVAVIGKPNVGKSTLVNKILGEERLLTSPIPGTTRDSIDTLIERNGRKYLFIDTAGIRRKSKITFSVERYSVLRAIKTIERADVVFLMLDAQEGPTHQDARIAELIHDRGKGCIILLNKWDLVPKKIAETSGIEDIARDRLKEVDFAPVISISALTGKRVNKVFDCIDLVFENYSGRVSTKRLNKLLDDIMIKTPPPLYKGKEIKFYYISQPMTKPPTFVIFTNSSQAIPESYKQFLENRLREEFDLEGTTIRLIFRARRKT